MRKNLLVLLSALFLSSCAGGTSVNSQNSESSADSTNTEASISVEEPEEEFDVTKEYQDKTGVDLLYAIFDSYRYENSKLVNEGYATEYYLGSSAYFCDYIDYINEQGYVDYGFVITAQGTFRYHLDVGEVTLDNLISTSIDEYYIYDNLINSPEDLYYYGRKDPDTNENMWTQIETNPEDAVLAEDEIPDSKYYDALSLGAFTASCDQAKLLVGTLGNVPFSIDTETGEYDISAIDFVKVRINQDYSLHFEIGTESFSAAMFDITNVCTTHHVDVERFLANPYEKPNPTSFTAEQIAQMEKNVGIVMPFPKEATYSMTFTCNKIGGGLASFSDYLSGDITASYVKQCEAVGWKLEEDDDTVVASVVLTMPRDESGTKFWKIALNYSEKNERYEYGCFTATLYVYPQELVIPE